jgi:hypothetical protein
MYVYTRTHTHRVYTCNLIFSHAQTHTYALTPPMTVYEHENDPSSCHQLRVFPNNVRQRPEQEVKIRRFNYCVRPVRPECEANRLIRKLLYVVSIVQYLRQMENSNEIHNNNNYNIIISPLFWRQELIYISCDKAASVWLVLYRYTGSHWDRYQ